MSFLIKSLEVSKPFCAFDLVAVEVPMDCSVNIVLSGVSDELALILRTVLFEVDLVSTINEMSELFRQAEWNQKCLMVTLVYRQILPILIEINAYKC